jgi:hypothetical protein
MDKQGNAMYVAYVSHVLRLLGLVAKGRIHHVNLEQLRFQWFTICG